MKLRILSERDCRAVLDMSQAIELQREAFLHLAQGRAVGGLRSVAQGSEPPSVTIFNPCFLTGGGGFGVKVVSDFEQNTALGRTRLTALVAVFDGASGYPEAVMEGGYLTDVRTGAGVALAARLMARPESRSLTLIGAGRISAHVLAAVADVFDLERVQVHTRSRQRGEAFVAAARAAGGRIPTRITLTDDPAAAVAESDLVIAATTSNTPVIQGEWLRAGTFVASAGSYSAAAREVDTRTLERAAVRVVDSVRDSLDRVGDYVMPLAEGAIERASVIDFGQVVAGHLPGRTNADDITYFKSCGVAAQDLITAQFIARACTARGLGTVVDIGGDEPPANGSEAHA